MAEEGSIFFANAYKYDFFHSLLFIDFKSGYFNFWANISGIISNFFPLKVAPLISNYLAILPKILIIYFIFYRRSYFTNKFEYKLILCLIVFISPQNVPEIWLNSINSQIYKKIQDKFNFIIITVCTFIQLIIVLYSKYQNLIASGKLHSINLDLIYNFLYNTSIKSFLGTYFSKFIYFKLDLGVNFSVLLLMAAGFISLSLFVNFFKKNILLNKDEKFILITILYSFFATSIIVLVGATFQYVGGRYAVLPSLYLLCLFLFLFKILVGFKLRLLFLIMLIFSITTGAYEFRPVSKYSKYNYIKFLDCIKCPNWSDEVSKYESNKNYRLKIWPYPRKTMTLSSI